MFAEELIVLDFETTGLSPGYGDRITEVAALRVKEGRIAGRYQSLANCGVQIPPFITYKTGITQAMVDGAPPVRKVIHELLAFIGGMPLVAHNASFDRRFLESECALASRRTPGGPFICSMRLSRRIYPQFRGHSLEVLAHRLSISYRGAAHRAGADVEVTAHLLLRIGRDLLARHQGLLLDSRLLRQIMNAPVAQVAELLERRAKTPA
jgi:DNA polymerase-3 subunit epsilon